MEKKKQVCDDYLTFGDCKWGTTKCRNKHEGEVWENEYFFASIKKICGNQMRITKLGESDKTTPLGFSVKSEWASNRAEPGNMVLFQGSVRERDGLKCGRVVLLLGADSSERRVQKFVDVEQEAEAFVLRPDNDDEDKYSSLSITSCKEHGENCKKIGIHVSCISWDFVGQLTDLPPYDRRKLVRVSGILERENKNLKKFGPFLLDRKYLAISVYLHSSNPVEISEPSFTPVKITRVYSYSEFSTEKDLSLMWRVLEADETNKMVRGRNHWYFSLEPNAYKAHVVADEALYVMTREITKFFRKHDLNAVIHFKPTKPSTTEICHLANGNLRGNTSYLILKEHLDRAEDESRQSRLQALRGIVAGVQILSFPQTMEELMNISTFTTDVQCGQYIVDHGVVDIFPNYIWGVVNQQNLLGAMFGSDILYEREDLLGLTVRRFPSPVLAKSLVRKLSGESVEMNFIDLFHCSRVLYNIPLGYGGFNAEVEELEGESKSLKWRKFRCDEIEFDEVLAIDEEELSSYMRKLKSGKVGMKPFSEIEHRILPSPYHVSDDGDLILHLTLRSVLRLQICNYYPSHPLEIGHRLLRVGKNGHICLGHLNHPELAFCSDRYDLLPLVANQRLEELKNIFASLKLYPTESERVISWSGRYNAGGRFKTKEEINRGDFLCIRKDIYDGERVTYVWSAHAVVTEDKGEDCEVVFATCTLLQPGELVQEDDFVIEYIKIPRHKED